MGQIQLKCNEKEIGFVDTEIPYDGELLIVWFQELNEVLIQMKTEELNVDKTIKQTAIASVNSSKCHSKRGPFIVKLPAFIGKRAKCVQNMIL